MFEEEVDLDNEIEADYLTTGEAAEKLGYTPRWVRQLINEGKLNAKHIGEGKKWLIHKDEINSFSGLSPGEPALRVIANPPFSLKDWGHDIAEDDPHHRFNQFGPIPPKTKGDLAFLQHMIAVTNATGMIGVVMPHGVLFRGGAEGKIRRGIIEADLFEAIIGLAPNLFYNASIPVAICVLNKAKRPERRNKILFVDAAQEGYYRAERAHNYLDDDHIQKMIDAFDTFEDVPRFAHVADMSEIAENDYNLNISRYVDTSEPEEIIDIGEALAELRKVERERDEAVAKMDRLLEEIGYIR